MLPQIINIQHTVSRPQTQHSQRCLQCPGWLSRPLAVTVASSFYWFHVNAHIWNYCARVPGCRNLECSNHPLVLVLVGSFHVHLTETQTSVLDGFQRSSDQIQETTFIVHLFLSSISLLFAPYAVLSQDTLFWYGTILIKSIWREEFSQHSERRSYMRTWLVMWHLIDLAVVRWLVVVIHLVHVLHVLLIFRVFLTVLLILIVLLLLLLVPCLDPSASWERWPKFTEWGIQTSESNILKDNVNTLPQIWVSRWASGCCLSRRCSVAAGERRHVNSGARGAHGGAGGGAHPGLVLLLLLVQLGLVHTRSVQVEPEGLGYPGEEGREQSGHVWPTGWQTTR